MNEPVSPWRDENGPRIPFTPRGRAVFTMHALRKHRHVYMVEGYGDFPVDMLRYDQAFCLTPIPFLHLPKRFRVLVAAQRKPGVARWNSFSFRVIDVNPEREDLDVLFDRVRDWPEKCPVCEQHPAVALSYFTGLPLCETCFRLECLHPNFHVAEASLRFALTNGHYDYIKMPEEALSSPVTLDDLWNNPPEVGSEIPARE